MEDLIRNLYTSLQYHHHENKLNENSQIKLVPKANFQERIILKYALVSVHYVFNSGNYHIIAAYHLLQQHQRVAYLPTTRKECFCPVKRYSTIIVKATVVLLRVVYMGTFMARTDSIVISFNRREKGQKWLELTQNFEQGNK